MVMSSYFMVIFLFIAYYMTIIITERKFISDPKEIITKLLSVTFLYAGISLIYFSLTGKPFLFGSVNEYYLYTFMIGFIALVWSIPELFSEFSFFKNFFNMGKKNKSNKK